jgi:hypothetical protein
MPAAIFSGLKVKVLKKILDLNGGAQIHSSTVDPTVTATNAPAGSILLNETSGTLYRKLDAGSTTNWTSTFTSTASFPPVRFTLSGAVVPYVAIDGAHFQTTTQSLTSVYISALGSGTSGSTVVQVNQYRSGSLLNSATASLAASSGNPAGSSAALSGTLSLLSGDIITVDVNSAADGASELSVEY